MFGFTLNISEKIFFLPISFCEVWSGILLSSTDCICFEDHEITFQELFCSVFLSTVEDPNKKAIRIQFRDHPFDTNAKFFEK